MQSVSCSTPAIIQESVCASVDGECFELRPPTAETALTAAGWIAAPAVHKWLDFGGGRQVISGIGLLSMERSGKHAIRIVHDKAGEPFAIIALSHIDSPFRSAWIWAARDPARKRAPLRLWLWAMLRYGFCNLGLRSIYSQAVEINHPSIAGCRRAGMKEMGRQRLAHVIDGQFYDRLLFDMTDVDFHEIEARGCVALIAPSRSPDSAGTSGSRSTA